MKTRPLSLAAYMAGHALARELGQDPLAPVGTFAVRSKSRPCNYEMLHTPEGHAVHQGVGCEGEIFNGPLGCWHSKDYSVNREEIEDMTQAVTTYQGNAITEVRQFDEDDLATLKNTICKGASDSELKLFVATCQHTGLDPFMKQIHCVMRNTKVGDKWVPAMTIQVGIDGYRKIADDTREMQGVDGPQYTYDGGKTWQDVPDSKATPDAARVGVWRKGVPRPFVGIARWGAYVQTTSNGTPNSVWSQRGPEQLGKCAEALALRRAFPAQMASLPRNVEYMDDNDEPNDWTPEQVAQKYIESTSRVVDAAEEEPSYADSQAEIERDNVGEPNPEQETYEKAETDAVVASNRDADVKAIVSMLTDCKQTWGAKDYGDLYRELSIFMPDGEAKFDPKVIDGERAAACVAYLRERRGEAVPA